MRNEMIFILFGGLYFHEIKKKVKEAALELGD